MRQASSSDWLLTCSGDIQIGMVYRKERLDVEVIRARGLVGKQGNKNTPGEQCRPLVANTHSETVSIIHFNRK